MTGWDEPGTWVTTLTCCFVFVSLQSNDKGQ